MRGLPPAPPDVVHVELGILTDGAPGTVGWWLWCPGFTAWSVQVLQGLAVAVNDHFLEWVNGVSSHATALRTCRYRVRGIDNYEFIDYFGINTGLWGGAMAELVAIPVSLQTGEPGRGRRATLHVPGFPDNFTDDHLTINVLGRGEVTLKTDTLITELTAATTPDLPVIVPVTVHRARHGAPLPAAQVAPITGCTVAPIVGRCARRVERFRRVVP